MKFLFSLLIALVLLLAVSCSSGNQKVSVLWTDVPELAGYVDQFNQTQKDLFVHLEYKDDLSQAIAADDAEVDVVVGRSLGAAKYFGNLNPVDFVFKQGNVTKSAFYKELLSGGMDKNIPVLLPVSFDLPVVVFRSSELKDLTGPYLSLENMKQYCQAYNKQAPKGVYAFSPRWNSFAFLAAQASGMNYTATLFGDPAWNSDRLNQAINFLHSWVTQDGDGGVLEAEFMRKYRNAYALELVKEGRCLFALSTLSDYLTLSPEERQGLDYRYPQGSSGTPVVDSVIWAGVPKQAKVRTASDAFLIWLFDSAAQESLIQYSYEKDAQSFGLAGQIPGLKTVAQKALPLYSSEMVGRVLTDPELAYSGPYTTKIQDFRDKIVYHWMEDALLKKSKDNLNQAWDRYNHQTDTH